MPRKPKQQSPLSQPTKWEGKEAKPTKFFGFIYLVTNLTNGRKYIGKKQYEFTGYVKQKNSRRRKKVIKPSGWETYKSSSKYLQNDIKELGVDNFKFEILWNCSTKGMLSWMEVKELVTRNVLLAKSDDPTIPLYYNRAIPAVKFVPKGEYE